MTDSIRIHGAPSGATSVATPPVEHGPAAAETSQFQALLERLQRLATPAAPPAEVTTADDLQKAVAAADSSFTTAMDLRRQLEEAFRRHVP